MAGGRQLCNEVPLAKRGRAAKVPAAAASVATAAKTNNSRIISSGVDVCACL